MAPRKIGRYEIKEELGRGGMATVYRAYDPSSDREVAIKVMPREFLHDPQFRERFQREIKTIALLEHPAIVPVYDVGEDDGLPYFVMRYMPGGSLTEWIDRGRFSLEEAAHIVDRIAHALSYAHKKGVIHRDLKSDNILFDSNNEPFLSDFGISKFTESLVTNRPGGNILGTPAYISPEQAQGETLDGRSDIYGLGVIVYQMLSGRLPYNADTPMGVALKHVNDPVPEILRANPDLPEAVDTIIKTAMAKERRKRYSTATELSNALNLIAFGMERIPTTPLALASLNRNAPPSSARRTGPFVVGTVVLVVMAGMFLLRNQLFVPAEPTATTTPTDLPPSSTVEPPTPTVESTVAPIVNVAPTSTPTATAIPFAPQCATENIPTVPVPRVNEIDRLCVRKVPYAVLSLPRNASYVPQSPSLKCVLERTSGDNMVISCSGPQLFSFDLKVCYPPATPPGTPVGNCPESDLYDEIGQCCYPTPPLDAGCTIYRVDLRACP